LDDDVERWALTVRASLPEAADGAKDDSKVDGFEGLVSDGQAIKHARTAALNYDVCPRHQLEEEFATVFGLEIEADASLVPVCTQEVGALSTYEVGPERSRHVAAWRLDLNDVGAKIPQDHRREGAGEHLGKVEHHDTLKHFGL
jgi:hypothetical protein